MIFGVFGLIFCGIGAYCELVVGLYERSPYVGKDDGVFNRLCRSIGTDLQEEIKFKEFEGEKSAVQCVLRNECDFTLVGLSQNLTLSYPVVSVRVM